VVGSRNIIPETTEIVHYFTTVACNKNINIISGLAKGVDEKAHITALENNSKTVAILPSSLDNILPTSNRHLANEIVEQGGLLLSEYPPGSPKKPENSNYLMRNRIQAGISDAVFVAQSAVDGGTMTTAKHAIDNEKKIITYKSKSDIQEYSGNRILTSNLDFENAKQIKLSKSQEEIIAKKKNIISDYVFETTNQIENIINKI
jgi:DNA processing protein